MSLSTLSTSIGLICFVSLIILYFASKDLLIMKRILNKFPSKRPLKHDPEAQQQQHVLDGTADSQAIQAPTQQDIIRYRYHHGCNVGSIFVLERWLVPSMFPQQPAGTFLCDSSELAAAECNIKRLGMDVARQKFEKHWNEFTTDADLDWLRDFGHVRTVRLPIGFWTLGPEWCKDSAFENVAPLYVNGWKSVKNFVARLHQRGIGTLIDVHGLPGGANGNEHSGTNSGKAELWRKPRYQKLATRVMCFIAAEAKSMDGVAGLQIVNEAESGAPIFRWYDEVLKAIAEVDPTIPIYVSDAWDLMKALTWSKGKNHSKDGTANPVVVDTHLYWCFDQKDANKTPFEICDEAKKKLSEVNGNGEVHKGGAAQLVVGEYSCVLAEAAWQKGNGQTKEELVASFGDSQSRRYRQRAGGAFFWTYKMDWMPGGEWGFKQMVEQGTLHPPENLALGLDKVAELCGTARVQRDERKDHDFGSHREYWDRYQGNYEHWRFEQGWTLGWDDAAQFFQGGDTIGMLDIWILKRLKETGQAGNEFQWEWEQGFRRGVWAFYDTVGLFQNRSISST